jgi:GT2 family glycosyltransferase
MDKKLASIIIVNYNGKKFLSDCLSSVLNQSYKNYEVILVDNASVDGSVNFVKKNFPSVKIIQSKRNLGFAGGNNLGIKASKGDYIVLLNFDTIVKPNWLEELIKAAESNSQVGIVGSKLLLFDRKTLNSTGIQFSYKLCNGSDRGIGEIDNGQYDSEAKQDVLGVCFASALIKRKVIEDIGLLDEKTFLFFEDLDYCIRARLRGYKVLYCPSSVVYHKLGASHKKESIRIKKYGLRNRFRVLLKNYSFWNMLKWGAYSFVLNLIISPIAYLKRLEFNKAIVCLYVIFWNFFNLPIKERIKIQKKRKVDDDEIFKYSIYSKW